MSEHIHADKSTPGWFVSSDEYQYVGLIRKTAHKKVERKNGKDSFSPYKTS